MDYFVGRLGALVAAIVFADPSVSNAQATREVARTALVLSPLERLSLQLDVFDIEYWSGETLLWNGHTQLNRTRPATFGILSSQASGLTCFSIEVPPETSYRIDIRIGKHGGGLYDGDYYDFTANIWREGFDPLCRAMKKRDLVERRHFSLPHGGKLELSGKDGQRIILRKE